MGRDTCAHVGMHARKPKYKDTGAGPCAGVGSTAGAHVHVLFLLMFSIIRDLYGNGVYARSAL